jgi:predicted Zn-dependent peptidase
LYGEHPLAQATVFPEDDVLFGCTFDDVRQFHSRLFDPRNMCMAVVGDIEWSVLQELLEDIFKGEHEKNWTAPKIPTLKIRRPDPQENIILNDEDRGDTVDINYYWIMPRQDPYVLKILYRCLYTLLNQSLREKNDLCYSVEVGSGHEPSSSEMMISVTVDSHFANVAKARKAIESVLGDDDALSAAVEKEKCQYELEVKFTEFTDEDSTMKARMQMILSDGTSPLKEIVRGIGAVTKEDVVALRRGFITPESAFVESIEGE